MESFATARVVTGIGLDDDAEQTCPRFEGQKISLSRKAREILQANPPVQGTLYWVYEGTVPSELRAQREQQGLYE